jgi:NitT/TauT family transport system ATP-binding protein/nitrate/nitrite transport system substrate-binding protein
MVFSPPALAALSSPAISTGQADLRLGFVPLNDAAPLLVAQALGLFAARGLRVSLAPAASWSALRDRLAFGAWDGAPVLAPMPIAAAAGLGGVRARLSVTATLGRNGNCLVLGGGLLAALDGCAAPEFPLSATDFALALAARRAEGAPPPTLAVVFAWSSHNYLLRQWLAEGGIDPERDVRLVVLPPPELPEALASGSIDGFCAGEPWGSRAVDLRVGRIVLASLHIWPNHPEKLLAFNDAALADEARVVAATAAVIEAMGFLADPANAAHAAMIVQQMALPDVPREVVALAFAGRLVTEADRPAIALPGLLRHDQAESRPEVAHARWFAARMRACGQLNEPVDLDAIWRDDLWLRAATRAGLAPPLPFSSDPDIVFHRSVAP